jgi:hypothetical protein
MIQGTLMLAFRSTVNPGVKYILPNSFFYFLFYFYSPGFGFTSICLFFHFYFFYFYHFQDLTRLQRICSTTGFLYLFIYQDGLCRTMSCHLRQCRYIDTIHILMYWRRHMLCASGVFTAANNSIQWGCDRQCSLGFQECRVV